LEGDVLTTASGVRGVEAALTHRGISEQSFNFNDQEWKLVSTKSTILASHCYCNLKKKQQGHDQGQGQQHSTSTDNSSSPTPNDSVNQTPGGATSTATAAAHTELCQVCRFSAELALKHLPEMVFPDNVLRLVHPNSGFVIEFNALDAMRSISTTSSPVQVACSEHWKASRGYTGLPETVIQPFDWTFSTQYKGTLRINDSSEPPRIEMEPQERLDLEKLKQRESILFYDELTLYEDELHDNGVSNLSVKIRVMPSGFFILLRFFLRVDGVLIKLHDTRIYFEVGNPYFLRQYQTREQSFDKLEHLEGNILGDANLVYPHLPVTSEVNEKVMLA